MQWANCVQDSKLESPESGPTRLGDGRRSWRLMRSSPASTGVVAGESSGPSGLIGPPGPPARSPCMQARVRAKVRHMEDGYTQLGTVLDRPASRGQ